MIETDDRCILFEATESMKSAKHALDKLVDKGYHIEAEKTKKNYILIGIKTDEDQNGFVKISMYYIILMMEKVMKCNFTCNHAYSFELQYFSYIEKVFNFNSK